MTRTGNSVHPRIVFGSALVIIGLLYLFDHLLPYRFNIGDFWPLIFVIWGIARFSSHGSKGWAFSGGLMALGGFLFLSDYYPFSYIFDWDNLWPLAIIGLGGFLITKSLNQSQANENIHDSASSATDYLKATAFLGGRKQFVTSANFTGGSVNVTLGGLEIDCSSAKLSTQTPEVTLDITLLMGGIELIVPDDWSVVVRVSPFLGGVDDKRMNPRTSPTQGTTLIIDGVVMLGGVEIISRPS